MARLQLHEDVTIQSTVEYIIHSTSLSLIYGVPWRTTISENLDVSECPSVYHLLASTRGPQIFVLGREVEVLVASQAMLVVCPGDNEHVSLCVFWGFHQGLLGLVSCI